MRMMSGTFADLVRSVSRRLLSSARDHPGAARETASLPSEPAAIEALLRRHVRDGMNCVDVGAHIGGLTALLTRLSQRGKHTAIEPVPFKAKWLRANFPQVEVIECAVADAPGRATLFQGDRAYEVEVRRLDDVVPSARTIEVLKLAADGGELDAFRGAMRILRRDRPLLLFEYALRGASAFQQSAAEVHRFLSRHRYAIYTPVDLVTGRGPLDELSFERAVRYPFRAFHFVGLPAEPPELFDRDAPTSRRVVSVFTASTAALERAPIVQRERISSCGSGACPPFSR